MITAATVDTYTDQQQYLVAVLPPHRLPLQQLLLQLRQALLQLTLVVNPQHLVHYCLTSNLHYPLQTTTQKENKKARSIVTSVTSINATDEDLVLCKG